MDTKTVISLRCWARPIYLLKTLDGLRRCRGLEKYKLLIVCDHYNPMMAQQILEAVEMSQIAAAVETELVFQDENVGCAGNFRYTLDKSFENNEDWAIFLEDDTYPSIDLLEYFEQTAHLLDDYFAACTMHRPCHQLIEPAVSKSHNLVSREWFEGANAFSINRKTYERIKSKSEVFGIEYESPKGKEYGCRGEEWLKEVTVSDRLGWDTPFEKYFRDLPCLYPVVGRTLNIGKAGLHLSFNEYIKLQYNGNWIQNPKYIEKIRSFAWFDLEVEKDDTKYIEDGIYYA